ncbi:hypothetical protein WJX72_000176 [[Myrmecia] bisecta]|uniref:Uncharacterized protein n=1 Tax=[Myrmecia] bisecta TaxID=41462 RepID=A0AAW1Q199_9CHLO
MASPSTQALKRLPGLLYTATHKYSWRRSASSIAAQVQDGSHAPGTGGGALISMLSRDLRMGMDYEMKLSCPNTKGAQYFDQFLVEKVAALRQEPSITEPETVAELAKAEQAAHSYKDLPPADRQRALLELQHVLEK